MEKNVTFQNSKGSSLAAILTDCGSLKYILIMAHGFSSTKNTKNFVKLAQALAKNGVATFRFDFYGHGDSNGSFANITVSEAIDDILQAIKCVKSLGYQKIGLLGSSFGGISSILAASKTKELSFLALKSPVSDYVALEESRYSKAQLDKWKHDGYINYLEENKQLKLNYTFIKDLYKHNAYEAAEKILLPSLIVHGNSDKDVPYQQSQKLIKYLKNGFLVTIDGADHRYTNEAHAQQMRDAFTHFVVEQCKKCQE